MTDVGGEHDLAASRARPRRLLVPLVVSVALLAIAAGSWLTADGLPTASATLLGANAPVTGTEDGRGGIDANNSPTLVRNPRSPTNLVLVNRVDTPDYGCRLHVSLDGGASWRRREIPFPEGEDLPPRCFAPDAAFDSDGTLYLTFVTLAGRGNVPNAVWLVRSSDGGRTLGPPRRLLGRLAFQVRVAAHPSQAGRVHLTWVQASHVGLFRFSAPDNPIMAMRTDDGGDTWTAPRRVSSPARPRSLAPTPVVGQRHVYVLYLDVGDDRLDYEGGHGGRGGDPYPGHWTLVLARSVDGGRSWRHTVVDDAVVPTSRFVAFLPPTPALAVDEASGRLYAAFHDGTLGDADVWSWRSTDLGQSFERRRRVNDTPRGDRTSQLLPALAVAPDGRLDVVYYDRREDPDDVMTGVRLQSSRDGGRTFSSSLLLTDASFDSRIGFGSERDLPDLGSRLALLSTPDRALAVWSDTRAGTVTSGRQDLARAVVALEPGSTAAGPLRVAAVGAAGAAVVVLLAGAWTTRRKRHLPRQEEQA